MTTKKSLPRSALFCAASLIAVMFFVLPLSLVRAHRRTAGDAAILGDDGVLYIDGSAPFGTGWDRDAWYVQVDGVMGGKSSGGMEFVAIEDDDENNLREAPFEALEFTGTINLDGGGFSSVRRRIDLDLTDYAGVVVTLRADGYAHDDSDSYQSQPTAPTGIHLQFGDATSYYEFSAALAVPLSSSGSGSGKSSWTSVYMPLEAFARGTRFGFVCNNNCQLNPSRINDLSVYVLFQEGDFDVQIASIRAVPEPRSFPPPELSLSLMVEDDSSSSFQAVVDLLRTTIASGGSLYDKSYIELCVVMYWSVLNSLLASTSSPGFALPDPVRVVICAGLEAAEADLFSSSSSSSSSTTSSSDRNRAAAWTLRHAIDAVMEDLLGLDRSRTAADVGGWLPTKAEAESQGAATCVARTSPAPGTLFDPTNTHELELLPVLLDPGNSDPDDWDWDADGSDSNSNSTDNGGESSTTVWDDPTQDSAISISRTAPMGLERSSSSGTLGSLASPVVWSVSVWALLFA
mmetsp:Transcript_6772/g.19601  ORF Transcript_6772/g.19601 Transcript_6772/m.19601 type:complete len:517 (+) Transcript_6772:109-1659(+)